MPRKRWIKLWTQETLYGTTSQELELDEQALWFKLLALAGDSPEPGKVEVAPNIPMTDEQIAGVVKAPLDVWLRTKQRLQAPDVEKISINQGIIHIKNWEKYQTEFDRAEYMREYMRKYRESKTGGKTNSKQTNSKQVNSKSIRTDQRGGEGEQNNNTTTSPGENEILVFLKGLRGWSYKGEEDIAWLREFMSDYSDFSVAQAKACRDYYSGKPPPKHKGIWKNRFRHWMITAQEFEKGGDRHDGKAMGGRAGSTRRRETGTSGRRDKEPTPEEYIASLPPSHQPDKR